MRARVADGGGGVRLVSGVRPAVRADGARGGGASERRRRTRRGGPTTCPSAWSAPWRCVGDPFAARERLDAYREAGADLPVVYPVATADDPIGSVARTLIAAMPV